MDGFYGYWFQPRAPQHYVFQPPESRGNLGRACNAPVLNASSSYTMQLMGVDRKMCWPSPTVFPTLNSRNARRESISNNNNGKKK